MTEKGDAHAELLEEFHAHSRNYLIQFLKINMAALNMAASNMIAR